MKALRATSWLAVPLALLTWSGLARADEPPTEAGRHEAKERFSRGLHLLENGDYKGALVELERVEELAPSRQVLYYTAEVYIRMGKPVDAVDTIDELLAAQGPLKPDIEAKARAAKEEQEKKIGKIAVGVDVPAAIEVDGEHEGDAPLKAPVKVAAGDHIVCVEAAGYAPACQQASVPAKGSAELIFELQPADAAPAHVALHSPVPGGEVFVDDKLVAKTPYPGKLSVLPGKHTIEIRRPGYMTVRHELTLVPGQNTAVAFDPDEDPGSGEASRGELRLKTEPGDVEVTVDGRSRGEYKGAIDLPAGMHVVKLEKEDFEPIERVVEVPGGDDVVVDVALRPTLKTREAYVSSAKSRRSWSYVALAAGAVVAGGSTGFAVWSNGKLPAARDGVTLALKDAEPGGSCDPSALTNNPQRARLCQEQVDNAQHEVDKYTNYRTYGIVGAAAGVAVMAVGVVLLVTGPDPGRFDRVDDSLAGSLSPIFVAGPDGAAFGLQGRF
jgi:hypothetical protein